MIHSTSYKKRMNVAFVLKYSFPNDCAGTVRVVTLSKIFKDLGYSPVFIGINYTKQSGRYCEHGVFHDCEYYNISVESKKAFDVSGIYSIVKQNLKRILSHYDVQHIISTGLEGASLAAVLSISKEMNVSLIGDIVEWYDKGDFKGLRAKVKLLRNRYALIIQNPKMHNILAISTLLGDYYKNRRCNITVIPSIIDIEEYIPVKELYCENDTISFAYAGSPGTKDSVINFLTAASMITTTEYKKKIKINLYGVTKEELILLGCDKLVIEQLGDRLSCVQHIPHEQVKIEIAKANFTLLVRPIRKSSQAGFPTKLSESFACGTPVIANLTSDLGKYLVDGENSIICADNSVNECLRAIKRSLQMQTKQLISMKRRAFETAKVFHYSTYDSNMKDFLSRVK